MYMTLCNEFCAKTCYIGSNSRWRLNIGVVDVVHEVCAKYPSQVWSETVDKIWSYIIRGKIAHVHVHVCEGISGQLIHFLKC